MSSPVVMGTCRLGKSKLLLLKRWFLQPICQIMYNWILKISEYCQPNRPKIFPFVQYYLFFNIHFTYTWFGTKFRESVQFLKLFHGNKYYHFLQLHRYMWWQIWPPGQKRRVRIQHNSSKAIQDIPSIGLGGLARNYTYHFGDSCCCLFRYVFMVTQIKHLILCKKLRIMLKFMINLKM